MLTRMRLDGLHVSLVTVWFKTGFDGLVSYLVCFSLVVDGLSCVTVRFSSV